MYKLNMYEWTAQATDQFSIWKMSIDVSFDFNLADVLR